MLAREDDTRGTLTVAQTARLLGIGRVSAYEAIHRGEIPSLRIGRRILVPKAAIERMLASLPPRRSEGAPR